MLPILLGSCWNLVVFFFVCVFFFVSFSFYVLVMYLSRSISWLDLKNEFSNKQRQIVNISEQRTTMNFSYAIHANNYTVYTDYTNGFNSENGSVRLKWLQLFQNYTIKKEIGRWNNLKNIYLLIKYDFSQCGCVFFFCFGSNYMQTSFHHRKTTTTTKTQDCLN